MNKILHQLIKSALIVVTVIVSDIIFFEKLNNDFSIGLFFPFILGIIDSKKKYNALLFNVAIPFICVIIFRLSRGFQSIYTIGDVAIFIFIVTITLISQYNKEKFEQ